MSYFVWTTNQCLSASEAERLNYSIKRIDPSAEFVRHSEPGNSIKGWIERPNDGRNDEVEIARRNALLRELAEAFINPLQVGARVHMGPGKRVRRILKLHPPTESLMAAVTLSDGRLYSVDADLLGRIIK
jgi:hypothetical protein